MRILWMLLSVLIFITCKKEKDFIKEEIKPYVISVGDNSSMPAPVNPPFFGSNNFIIDLKDSIYYFQRPEVGFICGTGWYENMPSEFGNLQTKELIQVSSSNVAEFVAKNSQNGKRNFFTIASQKDTLKSKSFFDLYKSIHKNILREDKDFLIIRRTWQEEDTVLHYKMIHKFYVPDSVKWDLKRTIFYPKK